MKDSDFGSAPPIPPRRRKRKNHSVGPVDSGAVAAFGTIRSPRRPRLPPPPPPPPLRRPRTIGSQNPSRILTRSADVGKVPPEVRRSESTVPEKARSRGQDCEDEFLSNDGTRARHSSGRKHREMVPIVTRMCREGVEKLQASLTTFRANLSPAKEKVDRRSVYSSEMNSRSSGYPPLFFTFQDFEDVMGDMESSTSRQLSNMTTFESPRTPKARPDLSRFSSESSETEDSSLLFRVTPTNLPFEKCLGPEMTPDRVVDANRFVFEDYVDRRRKPLRSPSTKLVLFGDDTFDEAEKDESISSHTASRVRFVDDSPVSKDRDDRLFRRDETGALDSLQGVDSLPIDDAGANSKGISPIVENPRIHGGEIDKKCERVNCDRVKEEIGAAIDRRICNDGKNETKDDRETEMGRANIKSEICRRVEPTSGKNTEEQIGEEIDTRTSDRLKNEITERIEKTDACETDEFGDVPFDSLIVASEDDPSSSGSAFSNNSKSDFQTILVRASIEPEPVSRRSANNVVGTSPNASTTSEKTIVTESVPPRRLDKFSSESINSSEKHSTFVRESIGNVLADAEDSAEKSPPENVRQTVMPGEDFVQPEIGGSEDAVNLRRNSFLKTMLRFEDLEDHQSCEVVAAHPKTPVRAALSSNSCSKFQRVAPDDDASSVSAAKEEILDELSSNFSLLKLKPVKEPREREPQRLPVDPRPTNYVASNEIYDTYCNVDSALECQVIPNVSEEPITDDSRSVKKSQGHSDACSQKTDEFIDEHVETGSINAKKANLVENDRCDAAILESTSRNPDDVANDKTSNTNTKYVARNNNNKLNITSNNEDDNNGHNNNNNTVNNNNNNNNNNSNNNNNNNNVNNNNKNNVGYCIDEVHQNKRNDTLEVESTVSIDKCAIVLRCKNNDNNSMTPVVLSPDQSSINNINNNSKGCRAEDDGVEDTRPMNRGQVKSFVKFYEVKREPRDYSSSNVNAAETSSSGNDEGTTEDTKVSKRAEIENDVAYTIVRRQIVPKNVVRSSNEQANLASENSIGNDRRVSGNGDADPCRGTNDDGTSNERKMMPRTTRSRSESTTTSAADVTLGNRKVDDGRTAIGKQDETQACVVSSSGTSNHPVPKASSSNIDERYTFYGTV